MRTQNGRRGYCAKYIGTYIITDPVGMGRKSCLYNKVYWRDFLPIPNGSAVPVCIWRNILVFHFAGLSTYTNLQAFLHEGGVADVFVPNNPSKKYISVHKQQNSRLKGQSHQMRLFTFVFSSKCFCGTTEWDPTWISVSFSNFPDIRIQKMLYTLCDRTTNKYLFISNLLIPHHEIIFHVV